MTKRQWGRVVVILCFVVLALALQPTNAVLGLMSAPKAGAAASARDVQAAIDAPRRFGPSDRILVIAPHPDDETLGAGGLLREATSAGATIRVVVVTNGDGFTWAVRRFFERLFPRAADFVRFGYQRQEETLAALKVLGVAATDIQFLGYPDRGIAELWKSHWSCDDNLYRSSFTKSTTSPYSNSYTKAAPYCGEQLASDLTDIVADFHPTLVIAPHPNDAHTDHWGTYNFTVYGLEGVAEKSGERPLIWYYLAHRGKWPLPKGLRPDRVLTPPAPLQYIDSHWVGFPLSSETEATKHAALLHYRTQMPLLSRYLLSFVARNELFSTQSILDISGGKSVRWREDDSPEIAAMSQLNDGEDMGSNEWVPTPEIIWDPQSDTLKRRLFGSADLRGVRIDSEGDDLVFTLEVRHRPSKLLVSYDLWLIKFQPRVGSNIDRRLHITFSGRGVRRVDPSTISTQGLQVSVKDREVKLRIPRGALGDPAYIFVGARSRISLLTIDSTAWKLVRLGNGS